MSAPTRFAGVTGMDPAPVTEDQHSILRSLADVGNHRALAFMGYVVRQRPWLSHSDLDVVAEYDPADAKAYRTKPALIVQWQGDTAFIHDEGNLDRMSMSTAVVKDTG